MVNFIAKLLARHGAAMPPGGRLRIRDVGLRTSIGAALPDAPEDAIRMKLVGAWSGPCSPAMEVLCDEEQLDPAS
jgi:hypothetical protein